MNQKSPSRRDRRRDNAHRGKNLKSNDQECNSPGSHLRRGTREQTTPGLSTSPESPECPIDDHTRRPRLRKNANLNSRLKQNVIKNVDLTVDVPNERVDGYEVTKRSFRSHRKKEHEGISTSAGEEVGAPKSSNSTSNYSEGNTKNEMRPESEVAQSSKKLSFNRNSPQSKTDFFTINETKTKLTSYRTQNSRASNNKNSRKKQTRNFTAKSNVDSNRINRPPRRNRIRVPSSSEISPIVCKQSKSIDNTATSRSTAQFTSSTITTNEQGMQKQQFVHREASELQNRRRHAVEVSCIYHDDGQVEVESPGFVVMDPESVYRCWFSTGDVEGLFRVRYEDNDDESEKIAVSSSSKEAGGTSTDEEEEEEEDITTNNKIGRNGWHRVLHGLHSPTDTAETGPEKLTEQMLPGTVDQLTAIHILQRDYPQLYEYDAVQEEYQCLIQEINALEKDRRELERNFNEIVNKHAKECHSYRSMMSNLNFLKWKDLKSLPFTWLEDLALPSPRDELTNVKRQTKLSSRKKSSILPKSMEKSLRHQRGVGLAILMADIDAKNALIGRCYMNRGKAISQRVMGKRPLLRVEGSTTFIRNGAQWVKYAGITGHCDSAIDGNLTIHHGPSQDSSLSKGRQSLSSNAAGTTYFLKFDGEKAHHRGPLPLRLELRLSREGRDPWSLRYLSTGSSYTDDGISGDGCCYYAEFDSGECWWGTQNAHGEEDGILHEILTEMDVHRVAFGNPTSPFAKKSSWIVIGKDGSVAWRNIPQGLHDVLMERYELTRCSTPSGTIADVPHRRSPVRKGTNVGIIRADAAAPCEVSLGVAGTYFVRFMDGTVDYSLPSFAADVCEKLEAEGKVIRNVSLHSDTYDCLVRFSVKTKI